MPCLVNRFCGSPLWRSFALFHRPLRHCLTGLVLVPLALPFQASAGSADGIAPQNDALSLIGSLDPFKSEPRLEVYAVNAFSKTGLSKPLGTSNNDHGRRVRQARFSTQGDWGSGAAGSGQTLDTALRQSLDASPGLQADRSRQESTEAKRHAALDAFMPAVALLDQRILTSHVGYGPDIPAPIDGVDSIARREPGVFGISATLTLFDGFKRYNDYQAARWLSEAGRNLSDDVRQQLLLETTLAYLAVLRDRSIIVHRHEQIAGLELIAARSQTALDMHDATRADVALAQSRLDAADGALLQAKAALQQSDIEFTRLTGAVPGKLVFPPSPDAMLPKTVADLRQALHDTSPKLIAARLVADAADSASKSAYAALSPKVDLEFSHTIQKDISPTLQTVTDTTAKISIKIPLYTPGTLPAIEEAGAIKRQKFYESIDTEQRAATAAQVLFDNRKAVIAEIAIARNRIDAIGAAVYGLRIEREAGYRTVTDALNAQGELADAHVALDTLTYERDRIGFSIAAALGRIGEPAPR